MPFVEIAAGIAVKFAFKYLEGRKISQRIMGDADAPLMDAAMNAVNKQVSQFFSERQHRSSPFRNRHFAKALRRAYLEALQSVSSECRQRTGNGLLSAYDESWLDALNSAIKHELNLLGNKDYLPPDTILGQNVSEVLRPDSPCVSGLSAQLESALIDEVQLELSAPSQELAESTSALSAKLYQTLFEAELPHRIPRQFDEMLTDGWIDEAQMSRNVTRKIASEGVARIRWVDLIDNFLASALDQNPQLSQLFFRDILCRIAAGTLANPQSDSASFRKEIDDRTGELKAYLARFESALHEIEQELEEGRKFRGGQGAELEHLSGEVIGLRTLLESSYGNATRTAGNNSKRPWECQYPSNR